MVPKKKSDRGLKVKKTVLLIRINKKSDVGINFACFHSVIIQ